MVLGSRTDTTTPLFGEGYDVILTYKVRGVQSVPMPKV